MGHSYGSPGPVPQREFRMAGGGFGRMAAPFIAVLVFFFAIMLLLGSVVGGLVVGIPVAVVATGALVGVLYSKFARMKAGTVVRFSEYGVELSDQLGFRVRLAWRDITRVGQTDTRMAGSDLIGEDGGLKVGVGSIQSLGLVGWGERITPARIPDWMRENLAAQPINPVDGRPEVAIPLGGIDPNWTHGAMGRWVRRYRPDLLGAGPQQPPGGPPFGGAQPWQPQQYQAGQAGGYPPAPRY